MALSIFRRLGRLIGRGLGLNMINAQGVVTLQEIHRVIDEIKALKTEVQIVGDDARMGRIHAAEHQDNLFSQVTNAYAAVLDMQSELRDIKYKIGNEAGTKDQGYRIMDRVDALQFAIEDLKSTYKVEDSISTIIFVLEELKSDIAGMRDVVDGLESDPVGKVAEALAEAARNLEVR